MLIALMSLAGCGGGGGSSAGSGGVNSTPTPTPTPPVNYDTSEYRASTGVVQHGAITAYGAGASGAGITVGVIDSGLSDPTGELAGRISAASRDFAGNSSFADVGGHGTAVSMVLAAGRNDRAIMGVAWGATILALRTDTPGSCTSDSSSKCTHPTSAIAHALDHAVTNGARVINISLGGAAASSDLIQAVNRATAAGTIIVIAGGNDHEAAPDILASTIADPTISHGLVIIAQAVDQNSIRAFFANGALGFETMTIGALGVNVPSINASGTLVSVSGGSFAAPQVAGAAALLAQAFPNLTSAQIVNLLLRSARDSGVAGADAESGVGTLDLARAFAPAGTLSLAGTNVPIAMDISGTLSSAMGDAPAMNQALGSVATDALGRAYQVAMGGALSPTLPAPSLAPALDMRTRQLSLGAGPARVAVSLAPAMGGGVELNSLMLSMSEARGARLLAARIAARISPNADIALGLATGIDSLRGLTAEHGEAPFLVARENLLATQDFRPDRAARLRWRVLPGVDVVAMAETGHIRRSDDNDFWRRAIQWRNDGRYDAAGIGMDARTGALDLSLTATRMTENGTALGARFAPIMGAQSATTALLGSAFRLDLGAGLTLGGDWRRGWTHAAAGGALRQGGQIVSEAWSLTAGAAGIAHRGDSLSLRLSRPLRVIGSNFRLTLPSAYDYDTGAVVDSVYALDLRPRGREQDMEVAYAMPLGQGWLIANAFHRTQPGNIAYLPGDLGGALRFNIGF